MGMDEHTVCAVRGFRKIPVLPWLLRRLLRRQTFCDEGRIAQDRRLPDAKILSQLVPASLSQHLRDVPVCMTSPGNPISLEEFEGDVRAGLSKSGQKELYSKYFYDDLGTALFEAITQLPEYGLTRADLRLLRKHARELPSRARHPSVIVELGSGSGDKAREILPFFAAERRVTYCPIDLSAAALSRCLRDLDDI